MATLRAFSLDSRRFNPGLYANMLKFWFDGLPAGATTASPELMARWFGIGVSETSKLKLDQDCRSHFGEALSSIGPTKFVLPSFADVETDRANYPDIAAPFLGQFDQEGTGNTEAALGLTLLLDQIPRNIFRDNQGVIYKHYDRIARAVFYVIDERRLDRSDQYFASPAHRAWFYMPLEHSESLADHELLARNLKDLNDVLKVRNRDEDLKYLEQVVKFADMHSGILKKFGRYPHRNRWMERETTDEEKIYLVEGGQTFGT
jgi:uncharacterized protein (DUF924 family)